MVPDKSENIFELNLKKTGRVNIISTYFYITSPCFHSKEFFIPSSMSRVNTLCALNEFGLGTANKNFLGFLLLRRVKPYTIRIDIL